MTSKTEFFKALVIEAICRIVPDKEERDRLNQMIIMQPLSNFKLVLRLGDDLYREKIYTSDFSLNIGGKIIEFENTEHTYQQARDIAEAWGIPPVPGAIATIYSCDETRRVKIFMEFLARTPTREIESGKECASIIYWKEKQEA